MSPTYAHALDLVEITREIQFFEKKYGITSVALLREIDTGEREESWEICQWLMLWGLRNDLIACAAVRP
jgi:hypothetical protein